MLFLIAKILFLVYIGGFLIAAATFTVITEKGDKFAHANGFDLLVLECMYILIFSIFWPIVLLKLLVAKVYRKLLKDTQ